MGKKQQGGRGGEAGATRSEKGNQLVDGLLFRKHAYFGIEDGFMSSRCCSL